MNLSSLFTNFFLVPESTQLSLVVQYRETRSQDFTEYSKEYDLKRAASKRPAAIILTDEEKALIKMLGISKTQLLALKAAQE